MLILPAFLMSTLEFLSLAKRRELCVSACDGAQNQTLNKGA